MGEHLGCWSTDSEGSAAQSIPTLCDPVDWSPQVPLSMGFSRQEYWGGLPCPPPGDLLHPGITPRSPACIGRQILYPWATGKRPPLTEPDALTFHQWSGLISSVLGCFLCEEMQSSERRSPRAGKFDNGMQSASGPKPGPRKGSPSC